MVLEDQVHRAIGTQPIITAHSQYVICTALILDITKSSFHPPPLERLNCRSNLISLTTASVSYDNLDEITGRRFYEGYLQMGRLDSARLGDHRGTSKHNPISSCTPPPHFPLSSLQIRACALRISD